MHLFLNYSIIHRYGIINLRRSNMSKLNYKKIIFYSAVLFSLLFAYYFLTSNGLGNKPFYLQLRRFIPMSIICVLTTYTILTVVRKSFFISFAITSLLWLLVYPIAYKVTFAATMPFSVIIST